jgi:hypothetical protein
MVTLAAIGIWLMAFAGVAAIAYALWKKPRWMHLDYDARLWRRGVKRAAQWARANVRWEAAGVTVVALVAGWLAPGNPVERAMMGLTGAFGTVAAGAVAVVLYHVGRAPAELYAQQESLRRRYRVIVHARIKALRDAGRPATHPGPSDDRHR